MRLKWPKVLTPALQPKRVQIVYEKFELECRYHEYHEHCQRLSCAVFGQGDSTRIPGASLRDDGIRRFSGLLSPQSAQRVLELARHNGAQGLLKKDTRDLSGLRITDASVIHDLFSCTLAPTVDAAIREYFGSEYLVHWFTVSATPASSSPPSVSFRWHCDKGPRDHLKLIVFLNDVEEHGGGTAFLNRADSEAVAESGYLFGRAKKRALDTASLGAICGKHLSPIEIYPAAGDAVLFEPSRIVHSGITPRHGIRYALTLCLLPSPLDWKQSLARGTLSDLMEDELWHIDATCLLDTLGVSDWP
jgi:hypothetical protein